VKKLLALAIVGGFIALTVGCPSPSTPPPASKTGGTPTPPKTDPKKEGKTHEGKVVKVDGAKLTMKGKDGEMTHEVGKDAKVTVDGTKAELKDLKEGQEITVTTDEKDAVTKVEAKKAGEVKAPEPKTHEGKVVKVTGDKLTMKSGDKEMTHDIGKDVKITVDGTKAELKDLKEGQEIKVTTDEKDAVTKIEAKK
jgi:TusA-related sulfurtransferase